MTSRVHAGLRKRRRRAAPLIRPLALLGVCLGVFAGAACESREHANPFDPANPQTHGLPPLLSARADDGSVHLEWNVAGFQAIRATRVLRRDASGVEGAAFTFSGGGPGSATDEGLENGRTFRYRLEIQTGSNSVFTAEAAATPGGSEPWIGDATGGGIVRLTPDGRDLLFRTESGREAVDLALEDDGSVWAADYGDGEVVWVDRDGRRRDVFPLEGANTIAVDRADARLWVGSFDQGIVFLLSRDGQVAWADSGAGLVEHVRPAAGGGAWVASRDHGVRLLRAGAVVFQTTELVQPLGLAVDSLGRAWVTDRAGASVRRYAPDGSQRDSSAAAFQAPWAVEPDGHGGAWVADPGRGGVVHLDSALREVAFIPSAGAEAVAWDGVNGRLWVCRPSAGTVDVFEVSGAGGATPSDGPAVSLDLGGGPVVVQGIWRR